jgi:hypothetical protein
LKRGEDESWVGFGAEDVLDVGDGEGEGGGVQRSGERVGEERAFGGGEL